MSLANTISSAMELNGQSFQTKNYRSGGDNPDYVLDRDWVRHSFMISDANLSEAVDRSNRFFTTADAKFTDGRLGCNIGINCRPQITPYTDIRAKGRLEGRAVPSLTETTGNYGMGRWYSEAIDDPAQIIYMRFGTPQFNSLTTFLSRAFDPNLSSLARTGRTPSIFYTSAKLMGTYLAVTSFPIIAVPILAGKVIGYFFSRETSKFYTLKPAMHLYWSTVATLVNTLAINMGIFPKIMGSNADDTQRVGQPFKLDQEYLSALTTLMPDVFSNQNYFDMFALANRAQRIANQVYIDEFEKLDNGTVTDFTGYLRRDATGDGSHSTKIVDRNGNVSWEQFINKTLLFAQYFQSDKDKSGTAEMDPRIDPDSPEGAQKSGDALDSFMQYFDAEFRMGAQFAVFRVDHTGPVSESFNNAVGESDLSAKLNQTSSTFRQARFSMADGNLIGGIAGGLVGGVVDAAKDVLMGAASGVTLGATDLLKGLMGDGYVDIPKHWQSSSASLPEVNYTIQLVSPYGNVMSRMMNLMIPLSMLLAGALPLSTGKQSHTSPFLVQIFDRGRCQIRLGIIESLTITRGTGNLAFDTKGNPLAIDISFKVRDMSSILHMPVSSGNLFGVDMTIDEDNILTDYLAVLGGLDMFTQIYPMSNARMRLAKLAVNVGKLSSPAYWAASVYDSSVNGILQYAFGAGHILEGLARGSEVAAGAMSDN